VHRDSQHSASEVRSYFAAVHRLIVAASDSRRDAYFGRDVSAAPREWTTEERTTAFDPSMAVAVFDTPEIAIDPLELARRMTDTIAAHPRIELRVSHEVLSASETPSGVVITTRADEIE